jgi:hypothetical protein
MLNLDSLDPNVHRAKPIGRQNRVTDDTRNEGVPAKVLPTKDTDYFERGSQFSSKTSNQIDFLVWHSAQIGFHVIWTVDRGDQFATNAL